ncbi:MAG: biopolymer transporter ExbD [Flavobacteriales bacterium]
MARRELAEINAGSMADIAFLLLVFFLVVTTMNTDNGMSRLLPPPLPPDFEAPPVKKRNIYEVLVNFNNQLLVEEKLMDVRDLRQGAKDFLLANGDNVLKPLGTAMDDFPVRSVKGSLDSVKQRVRSFDIVIEELNGELGALSGNKLTQMEDSIKNFEDKRDDALAKKYAFEFFGNYASLPGSALISVQNDNSTDYDTYVSVNNELEAAIRELRDEVSMAKFNVPFYELDKEDDEDKKKILAIRQIYPQRISEAEPLDVKGFGG